MYFLTDPLIQHARTIYKSIQIDRPETITGNKLFELFGPGNIRNYSDRPHERFSDYETLLTIFQNDDIEKYRKIHKGTPFYFLAWTAFEMRNYEKALFYMDAAISEDIKNTGNKWKNYPPYKFLTLSNSKKQAAKQVVEKIRELIIKELKRFNRTSNLNPLTFQKLIKKFVKELIIHKPYRTIITALYTFVLEFSDRFKDLKLQSDNGGSIEPFLIHLFKGGLIFESLLKYCYQLDDNGNPTKTLGSIFNTTNFKKDFNNKVNTSSNSLREIVDNIKANDIETSFNTASQIRNTTGHNLVWDNIFDTPSNYEALFEQQVNAIFYVISVKFLL